MLKLYLHHLSTCPQPNQPKLCFAVNWEFDRIVRYAHVNKFLYSDKYGNRKTDGVISNTKNNFNVNYLN